MGLVITNLKEDINNLGDFEGLIMQLLMDWQHITSPNHYIASHFLYF